MTTEQSREIYQPVEIGLTVRLSRGGSPYEARVLEVPTVRGHGDSAGEAIELAMRALRELIMRALELQMASPAPTEIASTDRSLIVRLECGAAHGDDLICLSMPALLAELHEHLPA